jgi:monovalent cation:H+ antiporter-2, CPA2 family
VHDLPLLVNVAVALAAALVGGLLARRAGMQPLVGYLVAGVAIGPFTPGFQGDVRMIGQLAELGVVFLMFGVGLHFSLGDLWRVRKVAIPGALGEIVLMTLAGYTLGRAFGWTSTAGLLLGLSLSVASTVVLLRGLMDHRLLGSSPGQLAVGWLVFEDLATVLLLLILPSLAPGTVGVALGDVGITLLKAALFVALMMFLGARVVPWMLLRIALMRSRELFVLMALTVAVGIALASATLFGVSLALGAFLAGVVVKESPLSHQVGADLLPFREAFAVLFFVSIGMLVDPRMVMANLGTVAALSALIVVGKATVGFLLATLLRQPAQTAVVMAAGLSQIGEFSFILGQAGVKLKMMTPEQYSLLLAAAVVSITLNTLMFTMLLPLGTKLVSSPLFRRAAAPSEGADPPAVMSGHVVIVGWGRVGAHIVDVLGRVGTPRLVVELDALRAEQLRKEGVPVLVGDAGNSSILNHAHLPEARAYVVTLPDEAAAGLAVSAARALNPKLPIVARAATAEGLKHLAALGAHDVIHPELEGGLELIRYTLLHLGFPVAEVQRYTDVVRRENYRFQKPTDAEHRALRGLLDAAGNLEITWVTLSEDSALAGKTLAEASLRTSTGASVVAILHGESLFPNPSPSARLAGGDRLGIIGRPEQIIEAGKLLGG